MAEPEKVYRCDECRRVVAAVAHENGTITIQVQSRHDGKWHETTIVLPSKS